MNIHRRKSSRLIPATALQPHIPGVIGLGTQKKVRRIHTPRIVTSRTVVTHEQAFRYKADGQLISHSMCLLRTLPEGTTAVAAFRKTAGPKPTAPSLVHMRPEARRVFRFHATFSHGISYVPHQ